MASSVWRTVEVLWYVTSGNCFSPGVNLNCCVIGKTALWVADDCSSFTSKASFPVKPSVLLVYSLYITEHVLQKSCLEVFALLRWTMLTHKGVIYIFEMHPSSFCLSLLGGFKCPRVVFVGDTCWAWMKILSVLLVFDGSFISFTFLKVEMAPLVTKRRAISHLLN